MFSTNQIEVTQTLVNTMRQQGYKYYVAYTNTNTSSGWNSYVEDLYIVFSKSEITATSGYSYVVPADSLHYAIRTGNYSSSSSAVNNERYVVSYYEGVLNIDVYEHIYTNAEFGESILVMPDINYRGAGEQYEKTNGIGLVVTAVLLFVFFCSVFKR